MKDLEYLTEAELEEVVGGSGPPDHPGVGAQPGDWVNWGIAVKNWVITDAL